MRERTERQNYFLYFTLPIVLLILICSGIGILKPDFYKRETADWLAQCVGQDFSNVFFIAPILLITSFLSAKGGRIAKIIWAGTMITNIYSYVLYSFDVHFNELFHFYCIILGLSVYSLLVFGAKQFRLDFKAWFEQKVPVKTVGVFLLVIAAAFYFLWLSQSLPAAVTGGVPASVVSGALPTNPVHALDYSFFLPLIVIAGVLLIRKKRLGYFLAPMMLVFTLITSVNIISLTLVTMVKSGANGLPLAGVFTVFSLVCLFFMVVYLRKIKKV
ncbi:hypothetical protein [Caproiciproducens galactitolivorans]|uniref:Uncharacterized protein n=1 Tax=Caproiciproducens galactitolivorans TaxID=642589 RepID=A0ABT4BVR9_9FIRM|nr:hypothetical protein [Caproiciproducens galactitolivorans]MCY1714028.1 hypothetical protein [Caproiciproducens galactitolivorans]